MLTSSAGRWTEPSYDHWISNYDVPCLDIQYLLSAAATLSNQIIFTITKMTEMLHNVLNPWSASKIPSLAGKVAVLTGGNEGIGAAFTSELLKHGISKVIIASNDAARHQQALKYFNQEAGQDVSSKVIFHKLDLGDYPSVKKVVEQIKGETETIDILDCDAAIGMYRTDIPSSTADKSHAIDRHFAVNNVGHEILIQGLLPIIKKTAEKTGDARIVIMASNLHFSASKDVKFASVDELNTDLGPTLQYNRSKLGNVLHAKKLARIFKGEGFGDKIFVNSIHPGVVKTAQQDGLMETYNEKVKSTLGDGVVGNAAASTLEATNLVAREVLMKDSPEGALSALYAATSPEVKEKGLSGEYIVPNGTIQQADKRALDEDFQDRYYNLVQECIEKGYGNTVGGDHQEGSKTHGNASV
jgi:WW domain-containing oxidoreductase